METKIIYKKWNEKDREFVKDKVIELFKVMEGIEIETGALIIQAFVKSFQNNYKVQFVKLLDKQGNNILENT